MKRGWAMGGLSPASPIVLSRGNFESPCHAIPSVPQACIAGPGKRDIMFGCRLIRSTAALSRCSTEPAAINKCDAVWCRSRHDQTTPSNRGREATRGTA